MFRLIEEVREKTSVSLETDDVYMNTRFTDFIRQLVLKSRGAEEVKLEYDAVGGSIRRVYLFLHFEKYL